MLNIGSTLKLHKIQDKHSNTSCTYHCKIIEKRNHYIWIDYPINESTQRTADFSAETELIVSFVGNDGAIYSFQTVLFQKDFINDVPALSFPLPKTMKRIQRRGHVRVEAALDIAIQHDGGTHFATISKDISAGGIAVILPNDENLPIHSYVNVYIVLPMSAGKVIYIETEMKVIRKMHHSNIPVVSMQFMHLPNRTKEQIMQYCFKKQREQRIMELS